jgi:hypothetical protein
MDAAEAAAMSDPDHNPLFGRRWRNAVVVVGHPRGFLIVPRGLNGPVRTSWRRGAMNEDQRPGATS